MDVKDLDRRIKELETQIENIRLMTLPQRIACSIQKACSAHDLNHEDFILPISKTTLAMRIGVVLETLSRAWHKLPSVGITTSDNHIQIHAETVLKRVCNDCSGTAHC